LRPESIPRVGIGGPVGSGKTALVAALCRALAGQLEIGVVTNDIYTTEDADFLRRAGVLPDDRILAVQTGACPHTAIRDDISANLDAVEQLEAGHPGLDAEPGALVACAGSRIDVRVEVLLGAGAAADWRELIVLGRTGEPAGQATLRWDVTRGGEPVLRQFADLGPALYRGGRVLACALISDPAASMRTAVESAVAVAQRLNDHTVLVSVLEDDARAVRRLGVLCTQARS
jgi:hypothetical protein